MSNSIPANVFDPQCHTCKYGNGENSYSDKSICNHDASNGDPVHSIKGAGCNCWFPKAPPKHIRYWKERLKK